MSEHTKQFLGTGFAFPFSVNKQTGKIKMVSHEEDISEAIQIILRTNINERVMRPNFGSNVEDFLFTVNRLENISSLEESIRTALETYEPRIKDINVEVNTDHGDTSKVIVNIGYVVRSTNNLFNKVYPFYLLEGAGI